MTKASEAYLHGIDAVTAPEEEDTFQFEPDAELPPDNVIPMPQQMASKPNRMGGRTVDGGGPPLTNALVPFVAPQLAPRPKYLLKSEISGVSDEIWTKFVREMKTASTADVSDTNALGAWEMKIRRLGDLGLVTDVRSARALSKREAWTATFVAPLTQKLFLETPSIQYKAFAASMRRYVEGLEDGTIVCPEHTKLSLSGKLAVLHRCGPSGLKNWNDPKRRYGATISLVEKTEGIF